MPTFNNPSVFSFDTGRMTPEQGTQYILSNVEDLLMGTASAQAAHELRVEYDNLLEAFHEDQDIDVLDQTWTDQAEQLLMEHGYMGGYESDAGTYTIRKGVPVFVVAHVADMHDGQGGEDVQSFRWFTNNDELRRYLNEFLADKAALLPFQVHLEIRSMTVYGSEADDVDMEIGEELNVPFGPDGEPR